MTANAPIGSMGPSRAHVPAGRPESHSQGVLDMLEPLIVNLLMACTMVLLAGWAYDVIAREPAAGRTRVGP